MRKAHAGPERKNVQGKVWQFAALACDFAQGMPI
jgi:hypothetical protein